MLTRQQVQRAAGETGFAADTLEKVWSLLGLLKLISAHPFLGPRVALKGGTALSLFVFDLPRLSVDIDLNYIGASDRATMVAERPKIAVALEQVFSRAGLTVRRSPSEHAGGKWRLSYVSAMGRPAILEVDINFMLRTPLWPATRRDSLVVIDNQARAITVLDEHELAAGKLAALFTRGASRDLFDARELLKRPTLDIEKLRTAFVVYGGINRVDWRTISIENVTTTENDMKRELLPMLRRELRPDSANVSEWTTTLVEETRELLGALLPFRDHELAFLDRLNANGELCAELLTEDADLQARIRTHPGLLWKAFNVKKHIAVSGDDAT